LKRTVEMKKNKQNAISVAKPLIGLSKAIGDLNDNIGEMARFLAVKREPILITGDSGTGKKVLVEAVLKIAEEKHNRGWQLLDCTAISIELVRSELFGYKKGAFTGAIRNKKGILTEAGDKIVFLDEIGDLPNDIKSSLLLAFEGREVMPVGGLQGDQVKAEFTLISATNKDPLDIKVLPKDLFHRIASWHLHIPGISERKIDIIPLICKIIDDFDENSNERKLYWNLQNYYYLLQYGWIDGGYRELKAEILYMMRNNKLSESIFKKVKNQNEIIGPWVTFSGGNQRRDPDEIFNTDMEAKLIRCNICLSPQEIQRLLETEILYYAFNPSKDHRDPAEFLDVKLFIYGLLQPFQGFIPEKYTPYTSYKRERPATALDNFGFRFSHCPSQLKIPESKEESITFTSDEIILSDLVVKHGYSGLDEIVKNLIYKHKILLNLTFDKIKEKYNIDPRAIKSIKDKKS
jgi:DNA-binding NtrC family response regulator